MASSTDTDGSSVHAQLAQHLGFLYPESNADRLADEVVAIFGHFERQVPLPLHQLWSQQDCLLITYGDSIIDDSPAPLETLHQFLNQYLKDEISAVHVLPFCPFSSDDGFAVIDYTQVNPKLGDWLEIAKIAEDYRLMADIVINHVSSESQWFQNYRDGVEPGATFFMEANVGDDLSAVVRPRASSLLRPTETVNGLKHVWCTFSHDQIDLDFRNPKVLLEFLKIIRLYLQHGVSIFRLDAVGFLWKEPGTTCMHLPQTHEVVKLIRTVTDAFAPGTLLITETNVPNHENLTYFGNRNEAHVIYNFSLAPLLVHALLTGKTEYLKRWMMTMPPAPVGCTYLNFTASHDGIGMRPAEGLLSDEEQLQLVETVRRFGGCVSTRRTPDGSELVYELNVSLFDALRGTVEEEDAWQVERFLCSQTVMLGLEGIPAFYIHSLLATPNDLDGVATTQHNRSINRYKWIGAPSSFPGTEPPDPATPPDAAVSPQRDAVHSAAQRSILRVLATKHRSQPKRFLRAQHDEHGPGIEIVRLEPDSDRLMVRRHFGNAIRRSKCRVKRDPLSVAVDHESVSNERKTSGIGYQPVPGELFLLS